MTDTGAAGQIFDVTICDNIRDLAFIFSEANFTVINSSNTG
jgi:hypothetical protein